MHELAHTVNFKTKSGCVIDRYCREPTVLWYREGLSIGSPVKANRTEEDALRDVIGFGLQHIGFLQ